jgi:hypothetical protein
VYERETKPDADIAKLLSMAAAIKLAMQLAI